MAGVVVVVVVPAVIVVAILGYCFYKAKNDVHVRSQWTKLLPTLDLYIYLSVSNDRSQMVNL